MSEWKTYRLGDIIQLKSGGTPDKSNPDYWGGSIPWISAKSMYDDFISTSDLFITEEGLQAGSKIAKKDSILLLTRGSGLFNRIPVCYVVSDVAYNQDVKNIVLKQEDVTSIKFLYYWLYGNKELLSSMLETTGIGAGKIDTKRFLNLSISLPSQKEQARYIHLMDLLFDKIELNRRINANLETQAQALFRSWFVDFEPFCDGPFVDSELGKIPQGWEIGTLSEIADITMGQSPKGSSYNEEGNGIIFYQGRAEFGNRFPSIRLYTTEPTRIAEINSVLLSVRAPVGDINIAKNTCCIGRGLAAIKSKHGCNSFILYLLQSLKPLLEQYNGEGTVFGCINRKEIEGLSIIIPKESVINEFEKIVEKIDSEIKNLTIEQENLSALRDTLLPKLMAGEIKIN